MKTVWAGLLIAAVLKFTACGGGGTVPDSGTGGGVVAAGGGAGQGGGVETGTGGGSAKVLSFRKDVLPIVRTSCATGYCHADSIRAPMSLLDDDAFAHLVNAPSKGCANHRPRVTPGQAGTRDSYLMAKLRGVDMCGDGKQMPPDHPLGAEQIELIGAWVAAGALENPPD